MTIEPEMAILCAVGENLRVDPAFAIRMLAGARRRAVAHGVAGGVAAERHGRAPRQRSPDGDVAAARRLVRCVGSRGSGRGRAVSALARPADRPRPHGPAGRVAGAGGRGAISSAASTSTMSTVRTNGRRPTSRSISRLRRRCRPMRGACRARDAPGDRHDRLAGRRKRRSGASSRRSRIGVVAAPNFALGVNLFVALVADAAAELLADRPEFGAWIHELHHRAKRDAPSGTAIAIRAAMESAGYGAADRRRVDARRFDSRHAHRRLRRPGGDDHADAHGARSHAASRAARSRRRAGSTDAAVVYDAGCFGVVVGIEFA